MDCNRKFVSSLMDRKDPAIFRSVRNIFLFGRGGTRNLKCVYRFEALRGERVRIKLRKVTTSNRPCYSRLDEDVNRSFCYGDTNVRVEVRKGVEPYLIPWLILFLLDRSLSVRIQTPYSCIVVACATPPISHIYPLSTPQRDVMWKYIL